MIRKKTEDKNDTYKARNKEKNGKIKNEDCCRQEMKLKIGLLNELKIIEIEIYEMKQLQLFSHSAINCLIKDPCKHCQPTGNNIPKIFYNCILYFTCACTCTFLV